MSWPDLLTALAVGLIVAACAGYVVWFIWHNPPKD